MTIYQGRVIDAVSYLPVPAVNLTASPGATLDFTTQISVPADGNGQFSYVGQKPG